MAEKRPFRAYEGDAPYVFISYSHKDAAQVYPLIEKLYLSGYNVWYDQGIPNNAILDMEIARHITRCEVFVLFLSAHSRASQYVMGKELPQAIRRRRRVIRVALDGGDYSDIKGGEDISAARLMEVLPQSCRSCQHRDPAPIEVDLSQGIDIKTEKCNGFEYVISNGQAYLTRFYLSEEYDEMREEGRLDVTVPSWLSGFPVNIGEGAFSDPDAGEILSVTLPDDMECIGEGAFQEANFEKIKLPEKLKVIEAGLFEDAEYIEQVELPYGLERIEAWAFSGCQSLSEIIIPETVKYIGYDAFGDCYSLRYAVIAPGTETFDDQPFPEDESREDVLEACEEGEEVNIEDYFHIICVENSSAHQYALEHDLFFKLISAKEMEETYQKPMREKHERRLASMEQSDSDSILTRMGRDEGAYACLTVKDSEYPFIDGILRQLAADGYRVRRADSLGSETAAGCTAIMAMLSADSVSDKAYIKAMARVAKPMFPLMLDSSPVPKGLSRRFIMHLSDRTGDDLLNEIREFLSQNGCRGNPRSVQSIRRQYMHPEYDYEADEDGQIMLTKYKGYGGIVNIPGVMFGAPVTSLRANLFLNRDDISEVTVSNGVKFIGQHCFESCTALREITIPPSVETIASEAFLRCSPKLVIQAAKGSAAALFAEKVGIKVKYIRF